MDAMVPDGQCVATGTMATARALADAVPLADGTVLIAGGTDTGTGHVLASAEIYDPVTGKFSPAGSMTSPRDAYSLAVVSGGKVVASGGLNDQGTPLSSSDLFDPTTGVWSVTGGMSIPRVRHTAVALADGRALIVGGYSAIGPFNATQATFNVTSVPAASAEIYDPVAGTYSVTGRMTIPRAGAGMAALPDDDAFVVGGLTSLSGAIYTASSEVFQGAASDAGAEAGAGPGTFTATGAVPGGVVGGGAAVTLQNGKILVTAPKAALFESDHRHVHECAGGPHRSERRRRPSKREGVRDWRHGQRPDRGLRPRDEHLDPFGQSDHGPVRVVRGEPRQRRRARHGRMAVVDDTRRHRARHRRGLPTVTFVFGFGGNARVCLAIGGVH